MRKRRSSAKKPSNNNNKNNKGQLEYVCDTGKDRYPNYRDFCRTSFDSTHKFYSSTTKDILIAEDASGRGRGGKKSTFPKMLYDMVDDAEDQGYTDVIAWMPHGRSFVIIDKHRFTDEILPHHFGSQNSFASFQRQLNVYGFLRMTRDGPDRKSYYHELFLRGRPDLISIIPRKRKTTAKVRRSLDPMTEPNLYMFPPCLPTTTTTAGATARLFDFNYNYNSSINHHHHQSAEVPMSVPSSTSTTPVIQPGQGPSQEVDQTSYYEATPHQFTFHQSIPDYAVSYHTTIPDEQQQQLQQGRESSIVSNTTEEEEETESSSASSSTTTTTLDEPAEVCYAGSPYHHSSSCHSRTPGTSPGDDAEWWHTQFMVASQQCQHSAATPQCRTSSGSTDTTLSSSYQYGYCNDDDAPYYNNNNNYYNDGVGMVNITSTVVGAPTTTASSFWDDVELDRF